MKSCLDWPVKHGGDADKVGYAHAKEKGIVITRLDANDPINTGLKAIAKGMDEEWIQRAAKTGVDTRAALDMYRNLVAK